MTEKETIITDLMSKARVAQQQIENYTQEQIDEVCLAVAWEMYEDNNIARCARQAVAETGMGVFEDKVTKHKVKILGVINDVLKAKSVGLIEHDTEKQIKKYAKPIGVIGALTPVTNPTATPGSNAVSILKGRNAVIFAPHPKARKSCELACTLMRRGLRKVGAPEDLIMHIAAPSVELSQELMRQADLVLATGGAAMVNAAYSSGTPSYGVGAGNPVIIVAEDAEIMDSAKKITISKCFDNATSCSSDTSLIIQQTVYDDMLDALKKQGAYVCSAAEKQKLQEWMWVASKKSGKVALNPAIVARSAGKIAADAGISVPESTKMLLVECNNPGIEKFSGEKISPVLALWKYGDFDDALKIQRKLTEYSGMGHSCGMYSFNQDYIHRLALAAKTSRIIIRQPHAPACGGNFFNGMPSTVTLGCGSWGGNITTENINWKHFVNITWVSEPFPPEKPGDEEIWGDFWKKYGK